MQPQELSYTMPFHGNNNIVLLTDDGRTKPKPKQPGKSLPEPAEHKCLVRACLGKKTISTVVSILIIN